MNKGIKLPIRLALWISFFVLIGFSTQQAGVHQAYTHTNLTDKVDAMFEQWNREDSPGAAFGIFKDGRIIYARGYGIANLEYSLPWTPQTVSRTGSISKQFIAMCIAILIEQGKLSIEDNIQKFLPQWPDYGDPVKIKHLLYHTSGIREYLTLVELLGKPEGSGYVYTPRELVDILSSQKKLNFKSGEMYSYSNSGYFLLSEIISRLSGMKTSAFTKKYIFDPLGMKNTHFHDNPNMIVKNRAYGYAQEKNGGYRLNILRLEVIGDLGLFTTVEDFLKWDQNFYKNKLGEGTQDLIKTMLTMGKLNNGEEISYAFGLRTENYRGLRTISHGGSAVGYQAFYLQFPDQRFSIVILSNLNTFSPGLIARNIADLYLADQFSEPPDSRQRKHSSKQKPKPISLSSSQLKEYAGKYYSDELKISYTLTVENKNLILTLREIPYNLTAYSHDNFVWQSIESEFELKFIRNKENNVTGFELQEDIVKNIIFEKIRDH
ncbi:MAG: serine hydrolase [Candidatus Aminicenantes bacterium]|nr:serine hydrolase [Candidatus Aminicenantes bacterium]